MTAPTSTTRSEWIDYAKGIAILFTLFNHSVYSVVENGIMPDPHFWSPRLWDDFQPIIRVAIFFFIIGMFVEKSLDKVGPKSFVSTRLRTLLYPYVLWQLIGMLRSLASHHLNAHTFLIAALKMPFHGFQQFWFMSCLLQTLAFYLACRAVGLGRHAIAALCFGIYFIPYDPAFANRAFATWQNNLPYFALGLLLGDFKRELGLYRGLWMPATGVLLMAASFYLNEWGWHGHDVTRVLVNTSFMASLVLIASTFANQDRLPIVRLVGCYSLEIYCTQVFAIATTRVVLAKLGVTGFWPMVVSCLTASVFGLLALGILDRRFGWRLFRWQGKDEKPASPSQGGPVVKISPRAASVG